MISGGCLNTSIDQFEIKNSLQQSTTTLPQHLVRKKDDLDLISSHLEKFACRAQTKKMQTFLIIFFTITPRKKSFEKKKVYLRDLHTNTF